MIRIPLELDRAAVAGLGDHTASRRAFTTCGRVVRRYAGDGLVRRYEIWNELSGLLGAAGGGDRSARRAEGLEELAALEAGLLSVMSHLSRGSWSSGRAV